MLVLGECYDYREAATLRILTKKGILLITVRLKWILQAVD